MRPRSLLGSLLALMRVVREMRLQEGITDPPPPLTPEASPGPEAKRGSYRLLSSAEKRGRVNYEGLDAPSRKRRGGNRGKISPKDTAQKMNETATDLEGDSTTRPLLTEVNLMTNLPTAEIPSAALDTSKHDKLPQRIVDNILVNCIKLNDPLGRSGTRSKQTNITTKVEEIQSAVNGIVKLEYPDAVQRIKQENAFSASRSIQSRLHETVYWEIIKKGAELLDPINLPASKGPLDEFTMAEKVATERFMLEAGYGLSLANQRQCRLFWKRLFDMRNAGIDKILLYRTKEFDRFCKSYPSESEMSLIEIAQLWEEKYSFHIKQLEERVAEESKGDLTGRLWLSQPLLIDRLSVPGSSWNCAVNPWFSSTEETVFQLSASLETSAKPPGGFLDLKANAEIMRNKSIFVTFQPRKDLFLTVCPIISIQEGDTLGLFSGEIRYCSEFNTIYGIPGPEQNLWLDYSRITGPLNLMRVSTPGGQSNVCLQWDLTDGRSEGIMGLTWRVSVIALRAIQPFEEIVRTAFSNEQYLLHRSAACAKRGYRKC